MISREQIEAIETNYRERFEVEGLTMIRYKPGLGTTYASDNDTALWTGVRLGQLAYRYAATGGSLDERLQLKIVMDAVLKLLTVTGTPGVLVRWAYPLKGDPWSEIGYEPSVSHPGNTFGDRIRAGNLYDDGEWAFETRCTRDQLSGILFGLTCAWRFCPFLHADVYQAVTMLHARMVETNWSLRDHTGSTGGTSAHKVDSAQRLILQSLMHAVVDGVPKPSSCWFRWIWLTTAHYNRTFQNVYGLLNNSLDAHSLLLLKDHHTEEAGVRKWWERIYAQMERDFNPHFDAVALTFGDPRQWTMHPQLSRLVDHPYDGNYQWNRPPEEWWPEDSNTIGPGLDVLLPYWLNEYYKGEG